MELYFRSMALYPRLIAPILFRQNPEDVHHWVSSWMHTFGESSLGRTALKSLYGPSKAQGLDQHLMGIHFPHPIGMAAGFDKDAKVYKALDALGFSFVEIGTLTPKPQDGNPLPRLFRLKEDGALINRMGFNNQGLEKAVERLRSRGQRVIGGNIGKNKITPNEEAVQDYLLGFHALKEYVDYFTVNVSSPNTPGLRALQDKEPLLQLLSTLQEANQREKKSLPILLKIAPDMEEGQLNDIVEVVQKTALAGVVATNTTVSREGLHTPADQIAAIGAGGLSGKPVKNRSTQVVKFLREGLGSEPVIIGVGGIFNGRDAIEKLVAGANLVQVYTGFIYEGPGMVKRCLEEMTHGLQSGHWAFTNRRV